MQKKIIIVNIGIGQFRGGGENFDLNLANQFHKNGYEVEFFYLKPIFSDDIFSFPTEYKINPIKTFWLYPITGWMHKIPLLKKLSLIRGIPRMLGQLLFEYIVYLKLKRRKKEEFIVHTCALPFVTSLVYEKLGKKSIVRWPGPIENFIDKYFAKKCWKIIANGDAYKKIENNNFKSLNFVNIGVNPIFLKDSNKSKTKLRKELNIKENSKSLIFVGRLIPIKNLFFLLKVFKELYRKDNNYKLIIIGEGDQYNELNNYCINNKLDKSINFLGFLKQKEIYKYYLTSDLFLLTSVYDNFPNVLIEAMGTGLPVIGSYRGGIPDIIKDGVTGYSLELNINLFVEKINYLFENKDIINKFSINSKKYIKNNYSWEKTFENYIKLFK